MPPSPGWQFRTRSLYSKIDIIDRKGKPKLVVAGSLFEKAIGHTYVSGNFRVSEYSNHKTA